MRHLILAALLLALGTPVMAGDFYKSTRPDRSYANRHSTSRHLSNQHIIGGRAVTSDYYRPYRHRSYGHGSRYRDRGDTTIIVIERDAPRYERRWR